MPLSTDEPPRTLPSGRFCTALAEPRNVCGSVVTFQS